jgi:DNA repair ATPase RecN
MIRQIDIRSFQSLGKVSLQLGRFTVITGRTGAGKSGLIRAIYTLAFNARGTDYITRGEKSCTVSMFGDEIELTGMDDDLWFAAIQRGGKDQYQLGKAGTKQRVFTKLQGKVPEPVSDTLRLGEINFATQWDHPYLLDATGGDVARVLGKLTNVTVLFKAAQEANRRRLAVMGELKTRESDLAVLEGQKAQYSTLGLEHLSVVSAEVSLAKLTELSQRRARLDWVTTMVARALATLDSLKPVPEPPSLEKLDTLMARRERLRYLTGQRDNAETRLQLDRTQETITAGTEATCRQELDDYVSQWAVCPTCGQPVAKDLEEKTNGITA